MRIIGKIEPELTEGCGVMWVTKLGEEPGTIMDIQWSLQAASGVLEAYRFGRKGFRKYRRGDDYNEPEKHGFRIAVATERIEARVEALTSRT